MPFYTPSKENKKQIDYDKYKPVYVYSHTDIDGKIRPIQFKYEDDNGLITTSAINSIKYSKDIPGGFLYRCLITNYGRQCEIDLIFYVAEHIWVIRR